MRIPDIVDYLTLKIGKVLTKCLGDHKDADFASGYFKFSSSGGY
jgi:hypothetical protein